jgi:short subunit fatty acid transporter
MKDEVIPLSFIRTKLHRPPVFSDHVHRMKLLDRLHQNRHRPLPPGLQPLPPGGGEWAIVGRTIVNTAKTLGSAMSPEQLTEFISRVSMAVSYGDSWSNMIQPFWTLAFFPIIAAGVRIQARDIIGYTFVTMAWTLLIFTACVTWLPI